MVRERLAGWLAEAAAARRPLVAVCHNGVLRAAYSLASGWDMRSDSPLSRRHAAAHLYHLSAEGDLRIKKLNILMDRKDDPA
jgi:probable phosphoglycerate mutase